MNIIKVVCYLNHLHVIQLSKLFTYPNKFTRPVATGVRISLDLLYKYYLLCRKQCSYNSVLDTGGCQVAKILVQLAQLCAICQ